MELFQEYFFTVLLALVSACVFAKLVSVALYGDDDIAASDDDKVVKKQQFKLDQKELRVKGTKSKKKVKFADDVVVKRVEHEESKDFDVEIKRVVNDDGDDVCDEGSAHSRILAESMERVIFEEKGESFTRVDDDDHDHDLCGKGSESTLMETREGVVVEEKSEKGEFFTRFVEVDDHGVKEDGEVLFCSVKLVGVRGDDGGEVSKHMELLDEEFVEGKSEDIKIDVCSNVKEENVVSSGVDRLILEGESEDIKIDEPSSVTDENAVSSGVDKSNIEGKSEDIKIDESSCGKEDGEENGASNGVDEKVNVKSGDENQEGSRKRNMEEEEEGKMTNEGGGFDEDEDDDWEGIERTELEKRFGEAVNYVECGVKGKDDDQLAKLGSDVQMQLYGLHKIAVGGPCHEPQPMALHFSARAKWNAWQKLGSMNPEVAMEEYIKLLSESVPNWSQNYSAEDGKGGSSTSRAPDELDHGSSLQGIRSERVEIQDR